MINENQLPYRPVHCLHDTMIENSRIETIFNMLKLIFMEDLRHLLSLSYLNIIFNQALIFLDLSFHMNVSVCPYICVSGIIFCMHSLKFSNWVSLLFLGFSVFFFYRYSFHYSDDMAEETSKSIYDFTVKVLGFGFFFLSLCLVAEKTG